MNPNDSKIADLITNQMESLSNKDFQLKSLDNYDIPVKSIDKMLKFTLQKRDNFRIIALKEENNILGLLAFRIQNNFIEINGLQGIKTNNLNTPVNWYKKLLDPFLVSCLKVYKNPQILFEKLHYKDLKEINKEEEYIKLLKAANKGYEKHSLQSLIKENNADIEISLKKIKTIKTIRDKYFTKEGLLNPNKQNVKILLDKYKEYLKKREVQVKRYKFIVKKRKEYFKTKIR